MFIVLLLNCVLPLILLYFLLHYFLFLFLFFHLYFHFFNAPFSSHLLPLYSFYSTAINTDILINTSIMRNMAELPHDNLFLIFTLNLHLFLGIDAGDSIQLAVKIAYPKEEISKKSKVRGFHIFLCHFIYYFHYYFVFFRFFF